MAFDENLAARIRSALARKKNIEDRLRASRPKPSDDLVNSIKIDSRTHFRVGEHRNLWHLRLEDFTNRGPGAPSSPQHRSPSSFSCFRVS